ncbi:MAG: DnaJ C-terminal domain-containing protein [Pseudomonadales bacterium]
MDFKNYYEILGVDEQADADEIKRAYRKLARKYHPDVSKEADAEARFKDVGEAYEVLKDPEKRAHYDQVKANGGREPFQNGEWHFSGGGFTDADAAGFSDFFRDIFGQGEARQRSHSWSSASRGRHLQTRLAITLEEAFTGTEQVVEINQPEIVNGRLTQKRKKLKVKIPAGILDGQEIRLKGQGEAGSGGGASGDLYVQVAIAPHPYFVTEGKDIHVTVDVTPWQVALGHKVNVRTLGGTVKVTIPEGANKVRLKSRGMPDKLPGDQYVHFKVKVPKPKSAEERQLYEQLARLHGAHTSEEKVNG